MSDTLERHAADEAQAEGRRDSDLAEVAAAMKRLSGGDAVSPSGGDAVRPSGDDAETVTPAHDAGDLLAQDDDILDLDAPASQKPATLPSPGEMPAADAPRAETPLPAPPLAEASDSEAPAAETPPSIPAATAPAAFNVGILLVNLGTPDAPDAASVRRYLREFLTDPRVIEKDTWLWRFVLNNIILRFRPGRVARNYRKIWNGERNESPLRTITRAQSEKLAELARPLGEHVSVDWAMRYGQPSIASALLRLAKRGCERVLLLPLYPQYAAATTATVCDEAFRTLMRMRWQPTLRVAPPYFDDPTYIDALATSIKAHLATLSFKPDAVLASFHGIPKEYVDKGDPYARQCERTIALLREHLGMDEDALLMTYQSRFGRAQWLEPYTDKTVKRLAKGGAKNLVVVMPGFSADCLETLEEIAEENAEIFLKNGGENFSAVPCLNDSAPGMATIWSLVERELKGWV